MADFTVDLGITQKLIAQRREKLSAKSITLVSESGLYTYSDLTVVAKAGVHAVLVGESLVKQPDIEQAVRTLLNIEVAR